MNSNNFFRKLLAICLIVSAALVVHGCGGGSGGNGDGGSGNGGGGGGGGDASVRTLAQLLPDGTNSFTPVGQQLLHYSDDRGVSLSDANHLKVSSIRSDGNGGFHLTLLLDDGQETVHLPSASFDDEEESFVIRDEDDGDELWFWSYTDSFNGTNKNRGSTDFKYLDLHAISSGHRYYMAYGAQTDTNALPSGEAIYAGRLRADSYLKSDRSNDFRERIFGNLRLTIDFGDSSVTGLIPRIARRKANEQNYSYLPSTESIEITNGQIENGRITANFSSNTILGEGKIHGQLYGPAAEEIGGAVGFETSTRAGAGVFGAKQIEPLKSQQGLTRSPATRSYATSTVNLDSLVATGAELSTLNSSLQRHFGSFFRKTEAVGDPYVKSIRSDLSEGVYVTYVINNTEQRLHFPSSSLQDGGFYQISGTDNYYWDFAETDGEAYEFDHLFLGAFIFEDANDNYPWMKIATGAYTPAASMPTGNATYTGSLYANNFDQTDPSTSARNRLYGSLNLNANFDQSTVDGTITGLETRRYDNTDTRVPLSASTQFRMTNGRISDGQFTATLEGVDTNTAAPLRDSVRGYRGSVLGAFYGPAAEEVGGVLNASRDDDLRILSGVFGGRKQ